MSARFWKFASIALLILILLTNAYWIHAVLNTRISLAYRDQTLLERQYQVRQLLNVSNRYAKGRPLTEVKTVLGTLCSPKDMFEKDGCLVASYLVLKIGEGNTVQSFMLNE